MANTDHKQPSRDEITASDELAIDLLFKRIAERGRKIRNEQQAASEETPNGNPTQDKQTMEKPSKPNEQPDPIVEILRLAYRRGLAIRRERDKTK